MDPYFPLCTVLSCLSNLNSVIESVAYRQQNATSGTLKCLWIAMPAFDIYTWFSEVSASKVQYILHTSYDVDNLLSYFLNRNIISFVLAHSLT